MAGALSRHSSAAQLLAISRVQLLPKPPPRSLYTSLDYFYRGLEGLLGPPATDVFRGMEREHCGQQDADIQFRTSNGANTTSRVEYEFVVRPQRGKAYAERVSLRTSPEKCRKPLTPL